MKIIHEILDEAIKRQASDVHLTNNLEPTLRVNGELCRLERYGKMTPELLREQTEAILEESLMEKYSQQKYLDSSINHGGFRFRVHIYRQKSADAFALRLIPLTIPKFQSLNLPNVIRRFTLLKNGLVLITGTTGSGKSTTLASLIDEINETQSKHIITIEDPVEFIHDHKKCIVNQREVGQDVSSFSEAVIGAMREDPDILLLGEMRDLDTIANAITMAETGHLVFATLHTKSVAESVDRIIDVFPSSAQTQIRTQLANTLQGIVSQTLLPKAEGGRVPCCEVGVINDAIRNMIKEHSSPNAINDQLQSNIKKNGSQTYCQAVADLYKKGLITQDVAFSHIEPEQHEILKRMIMS